MKDFRSFSKILFFSLFENEMTMTHIIKCLQARAEMLPIPNTRQTSLLSEQNESKVGKT